MHAASSRQEKDEVQALRDDELQELMGIDNVMKSSVSRVLLKVGFNAWHTPHAHISNWKVVWAGV